MLFANLLIVGVFFAANYNDTKWNPYVVCSSTNCPNYSVMVKGTNEIKFADGSILFSRNFSDADMKTILADIHMSTMTRSGAIVKIEEPRWKPVFVSSP